MKKKHDIRQRQKNAPISADADIPLRKPEPEGSILSLLPENLKFTITASPQDWMTLYRMALTDPEYLGRQIMIQLAQPVYQEKLENLDYTIPRGMHAKSANGLTRAEFMHEARKFAAAVHAVVSYWVKKPKEEWPDHFKKLISGFDKEGYKIVSTHTGSFEIITIVSFLLELKYEKEMKELGLSSCTEDVFRKTYLKKNYLEAAKSIFSRGGEVMTINELFNVMI